jgi:hypothetical protein
MIELHVALTNAECVALVDTILHTEQTLVKRMVRQEAIAPRDTTTLAYVAFGKLTKPIKEHLQDIGKWTHHVEIVTD